MLEIVIRTSGGRLRWIDWSMSSAQIMGRNDHATGGWWKHREIAAVMKRSDGLCDSRVFIVSQFVVAFVYVDVGGPWAGNLLGLRGNACEYERKCEGRRGESDQHPVFIASKNVRCLIEAAAGAVFGV